MQFPGASVLTETDVLVLYAAEGATIRGTERDDLEVFLARGGGLVVIHDAVCGDDPGWFKTIAGGAWEHGHSKWKEGDIGLYFADREHPITRGVQNFDMVDEIYFDMHMDPRAHVLANSFHTPFDVLPQMWIFEGEKHRAFVSLQGHEFVSFSHSAWRTLLLRGIAWAGRRDVELLTDPVEVATLSYPPGGATRPEEAHRTFEVREGFEVSLVAAEPLVVNPISLDWDERGRLWVACTPGYPYKEEFKGVAAHDEIVILTDTDGDGRMDGSHVFHHGLDLVTSLVHYGDGVIVGQAPEILWLRDTDGDDRADVIERLYSGFGYSDTHAVISNFRLGLDGWIYATQGYSGGASRHVIAHGDSGRDCGAIGNGIFRFRPDGSDIQRISSYGSNTWGLDFDWDGELFFNMANASHLRHLVLEESVLARARLDGTASWKHIADHDRAFAISKHERPPYVQIDVVGGFTAAAGCLIYGGGAWPAEFTGNHFVSEPTVNIIHRDTLHLAGSSYRGEKPREAEFLAAEDLWFRPVHMRAGPDGAMYVLDFYNQASVHNDTRGPDHGPTNAAVRPDRDHEHGRIWRVQHAEARALPSADFTTPLGLVSALDHPNRQARMTAHRLLTGGGRSGVEDRGWHEVQAALVALAREGSSAGRVHALWVLHHRGGVPEGTLMAALADEVAGVRKNAVRLTGLGTVDRFLSVRTTETGAASRAMLPALLEDGDARVRLEVAVALGRSGSSGRAVERIVAAFGNSEDPWMRSALLGAALLDPATHLVRALAAGEMELAQELARRCGRRAEHAGAVLMKLASPALTADLESSVLAQLLGGLADGLGDQGPEWTPTLRDALRTLAFHGEIDVAMAAMPIVNRWDQNGELGGDAQAMARRLLERLADVEADVDTRLTALKTILRIDGQGEAAAEAVRDLLEVRLPVEVHLAVIEALGEGAGDGAARVLVDAWRGLGSSARNQAFRRLAERSASALALLDAVASGAIPAGDLGPRRRFLLEKHADAVVAERARTVLGVGAGADAAEVGALIEEWTAFVGTPGDPRVGRELFTLNCGSCHTYVDRSGTIITDGKMGPVLTGMGAHGPAALLPLILDPNRSVEAAYVEYVVRTGEGRIIGGVLARDGAESILIRNADGEEEVFRDEIEVLMSTGRSPMPTGFESLEREGLRDLLTFLCGEDRNFRLIDIAGVCTSNTETGLYDPVEPVTLTFSRFGIQESAGIPFEVLDPARSESGNNVIVLKGAMAKNWASWTRMPTQVEIPVGFAPERVHVLSGIAAWGFPCLRDGQVAASWTWNYADGTRETVDLFDGDVFADWIARIEVPGSVYAEGILADDSRGQLRRFSLVPGREGVVDSITLTSPENHIAPTFVALTAQLVPDEDLPPGTGEPRPAAPGVGTESVEDLVGVNVLLLGGGSSHDFARWFDQEDRACLDALQVGKVAYTERTTHLASLPDSVGTLILSNNQPIAAGDQRSNLFSHVARGGGLVLLHPATWYNWTDWPEYNRELVGGGARGHEPYGEFDVIVVNTNHPVTAELPESFSVKDELYRFEIDPDGAPITVLAMGRSRSTGAEFPVLWTVERRQGRTLCTTLGHDGATHTHPAWKALLAGAVEWVR
jgi:putative membrane-bound dehydrogenase-like protein